jgi:hypothetical protein
MLYSMKKTALIIIITFVLLETIIAQEMKLPERISISDSFFSPWGTNLFYKYELELNGDSYNIQRITLQENEKKHNRKKQAGKVDKQLIEKILVELNGKTTYEIQAADFLTNFPLDSINIFFKQQADNYWINNEFQKRFIIEQLTEQKKLENNLKLYFKNYDHSESIDGSSTEVKINFYFGDSTYTISSKSILWYGLPIEINGDKNFSPKLAFLLGEIIPESKTQRKEQFSGKKLFSAVIRETINNHRKAIDNLESKTFQVYLDSLEKKFKVSNPRVINGTYSTNWNGEKRLSCNLSDTSMLENISIDYSTTIDNGMVKYPVTLIISEYQKIYEKVISAEFFREYLMENKERKLSIIYDDNSCFTQKSKEFALDDCKLINTEIDFDNSVFISLRNEFGNASRWGLLPNGQYFMWWNNGNPIKPANDKNYLKCE